MAALIRWVSNDYTKGVVVRNDQPGRSCTHCWEVGRSRVVDATCHALRKDG